MCLVLLPANGKGALSLVCKLRKERQTFHAHSVGKKDCVDKICAQIANYIDCEALLKSVTLQDRTQCSTLPWLKRTLLMS